MDYSLHVTEGWRGRKVGVMDWGKRNAIETLSKHKLTLPTSYNIMLQFTDENNPLTNNSWAKHFYYWSTLTPSRSISFCLGPSTWAASAGIFLSRLFLLIRWHPIPWQCLISGQKLESLCYVKICACVCILDTKG